jgi:exopolysaccharide biosynthesis protein
MEALGSTNALNIDAGGSSALWYNGSYKRGPGRGVPNALIFIEQ